MLVGWTFTDRRAGSAEQFEVSAGRFAPARSAMVGLLSVVFASLGPAYAAVLDRQSAAEVATHAQAPRVGAPWRPAASGVPDWTPVVYGADRTFLDAFSDGDVRIYRFVALYAAHGRVNDLIRSENRVADESRWRIATGRTATISVSDHEERINVSEIVSGERRRLVISFYALDGVVASDVLSAKLHELRGLLAAGPRLSSFVAIAVDMPDRTAPPLAAAARFLSAMEPLPDYLRALSQQ